MKFLIPITFIMIFTQAVWAIPRKYTQCQVAGEIVAPSNSKGFYMDENCTTVYVLPPPVGELKVLAYKTAVNEATCSALTAPLDIVNDKMRLLRKHQKDLMEAERDLESKHTSIRKLRESCVPHERQIGEVEVVEATLLAQLEVAEGDLAEQQAIQARCEDTGEVSSLCYRAESKIRSIESRLTKVRNSLRQVQGRKRVAEAQLKVCSAQRDARIEQIKANDAEFKAQIEEIENAILANQKIIEAEVAKLEGLPGAMMTVSFNSKQSETVREFESLNASLIKRHNLVFKPMPIESAVMTFSRTDDGETAGLSVLQKTEVQGLEVSKGDRAELETRLIASGSAQADVAFKTITSGQVVINRLVGCQLLNKLGDKNEKDAAYEVAGLFSPKVTYRYNVQVKRAINVRYVESHLYQLIKKSSRRSGLFRSKASTSITQRAEAEKWIDIEILSEDEDHQFADTEKLMMDIRQEFLDAALIKVAKQYLTPEQVRQLDPGSSGADQLAPKLQKSPNLYAQYAGVLLDLGSALFGGSTSEASMTQIVKASEAQTLRDIKMINEFDSQTFELTVGD